MNRRVPGKSKSSALAVTPAEVAAAKLHVKRAQARGVAVDPDVEAIANATPAAYLLDESEDARDGRPEP